MYQELKKYNFWRNLYGCKVLATVSYAILLLREFVVIDSFSLKEMLIVPFPKYIILVGLLIWICLFCSIVTKKTVKRNAFDYAKIALYVDGVKESDMDVNLTQAVKTDGWSNVLTYENYGSEITVQLEGTSHDGSVVNTNIQAKYRNY